LARVNGGRPHKPYNPPSTRRKRVRRRGNRGRGRGPNGTVSGRGAYFGDLGENWGRALGGYGGKMLGGMADTVFGLGAYNVRHNSLMGNGTIALSGVAGGPPRVINTKRGEATIFNHREYIGDLTSGALVGGVSAFNVITTQLNPGNSFLFPWLSLEAQGFQEFEVQGMLMELITEAADFSANFTIGNVMMAADYNPVAVPPTTKVELLELEYSASVKASSSLIMPIECARINDGQTHLWIADNNNYLGTDARSFDLCRIHIGSSGCPAAHAKIAEIWATYEIAMYKPKIPTAIIASASHWQLTGETQTQPFLGAVQQPGSNTQMSLNPATSQVNLPSGTQNWMVIYNTISQNVGAPNFYAAGTLVNCTVTPLTFASGFGNDLLNDASVIVTTHMVQCFTVQTNGVNPSFVFAGGAQPANPTFGDLWILEFPSALLT